MLKQLYVVAGLSCALLGIVGCAKQEFRKEQVTTAAQVIGNREIPPKIDILIVTDNTPSAANPYPTLQAELQSFVDGLSGKNWDFHLAQMPVELLNTSMNYHPISQVLVNPKYNSFFYTDGTFTEGTGIVPTGQALTSASSFALGSFPIRAVGNGDNTYKNLLNTLIHASHDYTTNFLRVDAPLAIILVSNGYDRTVTNQEGIFISGGATALSNYAYNLIALKGSKNMLRFYPIVSYNWANANCLVSNGTAFPGTSYLSMIPGSLKGTSFNFCNQGSLSSALSTIEADLAQVVIQSYIFSSIVLDEEPLIDDKFQVFKNGQALNQDSVNGWQYVGYGTTNLVNDVCDPTDLSNIDKTGVCSGTIKPVSPGRIPKTGYIIKLNGSARMKSSDTFEVVNNRR